MESRYTEEMLSGMEKGTIIRLFLAQQEQLENIDKTCSSCWSTLPTRKDTVLAGQRKDT